MAATSRPDEGDRALRAVGEDRMRNPFDRFRRGDSTGPSAAGGSEPAGQDQQPGADNWFRGAGGDAKPPIPGSAPPPIPRRVARAVPTAPAGRSTRRAGRRKRRLLRAAWALIAIAGLAFGI